MASFNSTRFLRCFDQLADLEEGRRNQAVAQLLADLSLPPSASEATKTAEGCGENNSAVSKVLYKNPLSPQRSYKFKFTAQEHNLLQYTLERLIRGLKADRKSSRIGFTVALLSVFALHGDNIQWTAVIKALLTYTSPRECSSSELKDAMCGRLYVLFALQRSGFFRKSEAVPELEQVCKSIWEVYDCKIYFQDAACVLVWLICRDVYRATRDPTFALSHVKSRLSHLLDRDFVENTLGESKDPKDAKYGRHAGSKSVEVGKGRTGVLPCALLSLYMRLRDEIATTNKDHLKDTVLFKSPLDPDNFSILLRYVSCIPSNHPVIGSFFDTLVDCIIKSEDAHDRLKQLWNSINLTMLDVHDGHSTQRVFTGLRLAAILFLKTSHSPALLQLLCMEGGNLFRTLCRYQRSSKGDTMKDIVRYVLQLLVSVFQGIDATPMLDEVDNLANPAMNDFVMYTSMHKAFSEMADLKNCSTSGTAARTSLSSNKKGANKRQKDIPDSIKLSDEQGDLGQSDAAPAASSLPAGCVIDCLFSIAESVNFSASSLTIFHNLFGALVRASTDVGVTYDLLESRIMNIDVTTDSKRLYWLLSMLQLCVMSTKKEVRMELLERFIATNAFCVTVAVERTDRLAASLAYFTHDSKNYRVMLVSNQPESSTYDIKGDEDKDEITNKLMMLSRHMLNSCFSTLTRALNALPTKKKDLVKLCTSKYTEISALVDVVHRLYVALEVVTNGDVSFVRTKSQTKATSHLPLVEYKSATPKKAKKVDKALKSKDTEMDSIRCLSRRLMDCCMKHKDILTEGKARLAMVVLYGSALSLMLLLLDWRPKHLTQFLRGTSATVEYIPQLSGDKMAVISSFAELMTKALTSKNASFDTVVGSIMSEMLLDTVLSDDNSPAFGLLHAISKGMWSISASHITEEIRDILLQNSTLDIASYDRSSFDVDESESDSESDGDEDQYEVEENDGGDDNEPNAVSEDGDCDNVDEEDKSQSESDGYETDDSGDSNVVKKFKRSDDSEKFDEESDIELSGAAVLDELLKDDEGNLEALRMERLKLRMLVDLNPDALKFRLRNLDMLESCISECTLGPWYVQMISHLYTAYQTAIATQSGRNLDGSAQPVMGEYIRKVAKVLAEAVRCVSSHEKIENEEVARHKAKAGKDATSKSVDMSKRGTLTSKAKFSDTDGTMKSLLLLTLQAVNGQCMDKTAKACRMQAVSVLTFALHVDSVINGNSPVQTTMVLLMALLSASLCKKFRLSTNFFVQLANSNPMAFVHVNLINIALESKVEFVQSELLSICATVVDASNDSSKVKRLCRRKSGKVVALVMSEYDGFTKDAPNDKAKVVSYITDDIVASTLKSLPNLVEQMTTRAKELGVSNETNEVGKRPLKARGVSPQLVKSTARLLMSLIKATSSNASKHMGHFKGLKNAVEVLLGVVGDSKVKAKHLQPLRAALGQLSRVLGE
ncbi:hypothetical protein X943_000972 [Babesia divergens]|uniref:Uncharacterized protein n=1 Tax=Babesia divergens TaxID=32595 RepID=A0AAD9GJE7_BABDI|nr:hypothetical protein X943_000972 [Babesia divergens]